MKKLSERQKAHQLRRMKKCGKRVERRNARIAAERAKRARCAGVERVTVLGPDGIRAGELHGTKRPVPKILSLVDAFEETATFLNEVASGIERMICELSSKAQISNRSARRARAAMSHRVGNIWDFTTIEQISVPVALMLASQYDRARQLGGQAPTAINYDKWNPTVRMMLEQVGFLELCGIRHQKANLINYANGRLLRFTRGDRADAEQIGSHLRGMGLDLFDEDPRLPEAITEAVTNVVNHAYSHPDLCDHTVVDSWWLTGMVRESDGERVVMIVVYDQGASIPKTLPYSKKYPAFVDAFRTFFGMETASSDPRHDAESILCAMDLGASSTGLGYRGRGLALIVESLELCSKGSISVFSRYGAVRYRKDGEGEIMKSPVNHRSAIMGTAVIWNLVI